MTGVDSTEPTLEDTARRVRGEGAVVGRPLACPVNRGRVEVAEVVPVVPKMGLSSARGVVLDTVAFPRVRRPTEGNRWIRLGLNNPVSSASLGPRTSRASRASRASRFSRALVSIRNDVIPRVLRRSVVDVVTALPLFRGAADDG